MRKAAGDEKAKDGGWWGGEDKSQPACSLLLQSFTFHYSFLRLLSLPQMWHLSHWATLSHTTNFNVFVAGKDRYGHQPLHKQVSHSSRLWWQSQWALIPPLTMGENVSSVRQISLQLREGSPDWRDEKLFICPVLSQVSFDFIGFKLLLPGQRGFWHLLDQFLHWTLWGCWPNDPEGGEMKNIPETWDTRPSGKGSIKVMLAHSKCRYLPTCPVHIFSYYSTYMHKS